MSTGGWYLLWHPERPDEPQVLHAISERMARNLVVLPKDRLLHCQRCKHRPTILEQAAYLQDSIGLAEKAIGHWPKTDPEAKNRARALVCFKYAFKRSYKKWEAMALSDIVMASRVSYGEPVPDEEEEEIDLIPPGEEDTKITIENEVTEIANGDKDNGEDKAVQSDDAANDPGGRGNSGVRLGGASWADKVRPKPEAKREQTMEALGDPRDPDVIAKKARLRGGRVS